MSRPDLVAELPQARPTREGAPKRARRFAAVPPGAAADRDLGAPDHRVLNAICWKVFRQGDEWAADPSHQVIAKRASVDVRNLGPSLAKLQARGYVTLTRIGRKNAFTIHYPTDDPDRRNAAAEFMPGHEREAPASPPEFMPGHENGQPAEFMPGHENRTGGEFMPGHERSATGSPEFMPGHDPNSCPGMNKLIPGHELHIESEEEEDYEKSKTKTLALALEDDPAERLDAAFDEVWAAWPRKRSKADALKAYRAATRKTSDAAILIGVRRFVDEERRKGTELGYIPYLATWLRRARWEDEPEAPTSQSRSGNAMATAVDELMDAAQRFEEGRP